MRDGSGRQLHLTGTSLDGLLARAKLARKPQMRSLAGYCICGGALIYSVGVLRGVRAVGTEQQAKAVGVAAASVGAAVESERQLAVAGQSLTTGACTAPWLPLHHQHVS